MSPELERLLEARYARDNSAPHHRSQREATYRRLFADALDRKPPGFSREEFEMALNDRYLEFKRARRKNSFLPPKA